MMEKFTKLNIFPTARKTDIVVQELDRELLLYDLRTNKAYSLNETSATIWRCCDGKTTFQELVHKIDSLSEELILLALNDFQKENLLDERIETGFADTRINRRRILLKHAAAALAIPVIASFIAPTAVRAQSSCTADGATFTLMSTLDTDCFTPPSIDMCCNGAISMTALTPPNILICTCGLNVIPPIN